MEAEPAHPIARYCERHKLLQRDFAARVGLSAPFISQLINGRERCGAGAARRISDGTGGEITVEELILWPLAA